MTHPLRSCLLRMVTLAGTVAASFLASNASAAPIVLAYDGAVSLSTVGPFPLGTPVHFEWLINGSAPDECASNSRMSIFTGSSTTWSMGGLTYTTPSDQLLLNTNISFGCGPGFIWNDAELRAAAWSGPDLPGYVLQRVTNLFGNPREVFVTSGTGDGGDALLPFLLSSHLLALNLVGPYFNDSPGGQDRIRADVRLTSITVIPEPASFALVLTGISAVWRFRRRALVPVRATKPGRYDVRARRGYVVGAPVARGDR